MGVEHYADARGNFYPDFREGDLIQAGEVFGFINQFGRRAQRAKRSGKIRFIESRGMRVRFGALICVIGDPMEV